MPNSFWDHPIATIEKALHIRKQIEALEKDLSEIYSGTVKHATTKKADGREGKRKKTGASTSEAKPPGKKRKVSAASRANMAAAQRARWAKQKIAPMLNPPNNLVW